MSICTIELNDSEIRVASGNEIICRSPGYAFIEKDRIDLGTDAMKKARLQPRAAHNRYWKNLNQDPLQYPSSRARHNADLAYAQLLAIHEQAGKPDEVIFAVPGSCSNEQLALLLGLVEASPLQAIGLVDSAVAAAALVAGRGHFVHIDMHLHQTILTRLKVDERISRTYVHLVDGVGLSAVFDRTAHLIADLFIKESRFDPQHHPETEQALYDQIPACLQSLQMHSEVPLEIQYQHSLHYARLPVELLLQTLQPLYQKILAAIEDTDACLISDRVAQLPGLTEQLGKTEILAPTTVFEACASHVADIRSSGPALNFVTSLPAATDPLITEIPQPAQPVAAPVINEQPPATHVLHGHSAHALHRQALYLSTSGKVSAAAPGESHCSASRQDERVRLQPGTGPGVRLNGKLLSQATDVGAGDVISFEGLQTEYRFIHVKD